MTNLRTAAQQALEALEADNSKLWPSEKRTTTITNLRAALAQQAEPLNLSDRAVQRRLATQWGYVPAAQAEPVEPVARECSDPMCACRGGPCAGCEEGQREKEIEDLRSSLDFYKRLCEAIKSWQSKMRDPERTIVCDILANGFTLDPAFAGDRYTAPPKAEPAQEPGAWVASPDGRVIYDDISKDDGLLRVSGDFEDDEQRVRYAKQIVDKLNAAPAQQAEPVAADALTEPKSGDKWRVEWWNESCRMMLPAHAKLDSFVAYKNGTIQFTIKRTAA